MFESRISRERRTIEAMIRLYCHDLHATRVELCPECRELREYADRKLDDCPFREEKPTCNQCIVHCYSAEMRNRIKDVMRYAGPRMLRRHPILAIRHIIDEFRGKAGK
jgi:hypothetical protein